MDADLDNSVKTIITCCVLHNICQKKGDLYINNDEVLENILKIECLMRGGHNNNQNCLLETYQQNICLETYERVCNI